MNMLFLLGGKDAEMVAIEQLLKAQGAKYVDHQLSWGANVASYKEEIEGAIKAGKTAPVCIELEGAEATYGEKVIVVDHHSYDWCDYTDRPAAILQVCELLGVKPTRHQRLIAANDSGYIPGMEAIGATKEEIAEIRRLDRAAQGITQRQEEEAENALKGRQRINGVTVVHMQHSKCAPITDALYGTADGDSILIICGDGERDYYGDGVVCDRLHKAFPGSWAGGEGLGKAGGSAYFGCYNATEEDLLDVIG